ncbi:MAG: acyl carrier protein [Gammaproteobacteria bacterium]
MSETIISTVIRAIAKQKHLEPSAIKNTSSLEELGITSLDAITIVFDIEEEFGIEVPGEELEGLQTVQDIVESVSGLLSTS